MKKLLTLLTLATVSASVWGTNSTDIPINTQQQNRKTPIDQIISDIIKDKNEKLIINELNRLVKRDTDINKQDAKGRSLLFYALAKGKEEVAEYLIKNGANKNEQFRNGYSPLIYAIFKGKSKTENKPNFLDFLLNSGVDINKKNAYGCTPLCLLKAEILSLRMKNTVKDEIDDTEDYINYADVYTQYYVNIEKLLLKHGAQINHEIAGEVENKCNKPFEEDIRAFGSMLGWQKIAERCKNLGIPLHKIFYETVKKIV